MIFISKDFIYMCLHVCACVQVPAEPRRECWKSLQLELQAVVGHLMSMLGTKLQSSERVASILNLGVMSPATHLHSETQPWRTPCVASLGVSQQLL